jgi:hypothetical protein
MQQCWVGFMNAFCNTLGLMHNEWQGIFNLQILHKPDARRFGNIEDHLASSDSESTTVIESCTWQQVHDLMKIQPYK